jgi:DhnA family fructose-bisphosphate aldolase class Ia
VPIVMAGGNIFQSETPKAMLAAFNAVAHKNPKPKKALQLHQSLKAKS